MVYTNPPVRLESVTMTGSQDTYFIAPLPEAIEGLHLFQAEFDVAEENPLEHHLGGFFIDQNVD